MTTMSPALAELARELVSSPDYVSGARPFPRRLSEEDAVALAAAMHAAMDAATAARAAAGARAGTPVVCAPGCDACCEEPIMVFLPEAARVARWLERPENAAARRAFRAAFPRWRAQVGEDPSRLADAFQQADDDAVLAAHLEQWRKRVPCAFDVDGTCAVYPVRPLVCRNAHATGTSSRCRIDDPSHVPVARLRARSFDDFLDGARACLRAAHHAAGGPRLRPEALCVAVDALLEARTG
jgi:Fe-S-cluster containining protein